MSDRLMSEYQMPEEQKEAAVEAAWRVWRTARDQRLVSNKKRLANLMKARLTRRKAKLRLKMMQAFKVKTSSI